MIFALAGNQNCGKTTLFNALTGSNQHVGNFPGVTVEQKIGEIRHAPECSVVDLPGIYSLRPYTQEEIVTRDFILNEKPDGIINIIDANNIERNLYLTLQLLELRIPTVIAVNMMDEIRGNGGSINVRLLTERLGVPVIPISAVKNEGISELVRTIVEITKNRELPKVTDFCPSGAVHRCIHAVSHLIEDHAAILGISSRFCASKLIENDAEMTERLGINQNERELLEHSVIEMEAETGLDRNAAMADMRYNFIESVCGEAVIRAHESKEHKRSVKIDSILTHKYLSIPIFIGIMLLVFYLSFNVIGEALSNLLSTGIDAVTAIADKALTSYGINPVIHSLVIDGIFAGVGSVLSFLPIIVVLFFFLSILEDTGYMARIAFVMDKPLRKIGLSGKSFVPMLIGFGCTVPAIMSSRTLSSERDRKMTVLLTPYMSCSAKIPVYAVFCTAFFGKYSAVAMVVIYIFGILTAILMAALFKSSLFKGKPIPFVMELPNYRLPSAESVLLLMWEKAKDFIKKAFTVIFIATVIIWFFQSFDTRLNPVRDSADSILALIGQKITPIFTPLGFGDWRVTTSLISGFTAKEAVISTMSVLIGVGTADLGAALSLIFTPLSAASFLVFTLLYTPCIAAVATIKKELGSTLQTVGVVAMQCVVAWVMAFIVYNIGVIL